MLSVCKILLRYKMVYCIAVSHFLFENEWNDRDI